MEDKFFFGTDIYLPAPMFFHELLWRLNGCYGLSWGLRWFLWGFNATLWTDKKAEILPAKRTWHFCIANQTIIVSSSLHWSMLHRGLYCSDLPCIINLLWNYAEEVNAFQPILVCITGSWCVLLDTLLCTLHCTVLNWTITVHSSFH